MGQNGTHGGRRCTGALADVRECGRLRCSGQGPVDCTYEQWSPWGHCTKCGGQRFRVRSIRSSPLRGGRPCNQARTQETAACPSNCAMQEVCAWGNWDVWTPCSVTCGTGGRRHRRRQLELTSINNGRSLPSVEYMVKRYEDLQLHVSTLERRDPREMLLAWVAGCASLVTILVGLRACSVAINGLWPLRSRQPVYSRLLNVEGAEELPGVSMVSSQLPGLTELEELPLLDADLLGFQ